MSRVGGSYSWLFYGIHLGVTHSPLVKSLWRQLVERHRVRGPHRINWIPVVVTMRLVKLLVVQIILALIVWHSVRTLQHHIILALPILIVSVAPSTRRHVLIERIPCRLTFLVARATIAVWSHIHSHHWRLRDLLSSMIGCSPPRGVLSTIQRPASITSSTTMSSTFPIPITSSSIASTLPIQLLITTTARHIPQTIPLRFHPEYLLPRQLILLLLQCILSIPIGYLLLSLPACSLLLLELAFSWSHHCGLLVLRDHSILVPGIAHILISLAVPGARLLMAASKWPVLSSEPLVQVLLLLLVVILLMHVPRSDDAHKLWISKPLLNLNNCSKIRKKAQ